MGGRTRRATATGSAIFCVLSLAQDRPPPPDTGQRLFVDKKWRSGPERATPVVALIKGAVFALDSLLEEAGFEASVPLAELEDREVMASTLTGSSLGRTEGSNPAPSSGESRRKSDEQRS